LPISGGGARHSLSRRSIQIICHSIRASGAFFLTFIQANIHAERAFARVVPRAGSHGTCKQPVNLLTKK
ncbi:hypothetical protein, partial [Xanthomonas maliensis]|uniref:hypothetical protein n=1 Tax=Xanthomonas maliensis TaxID=1321368 RepID=UPI001EE1ECF0